MHRSPLKLQGEFHSLPNISMDKFPMFFGNTSKYEEKHLVKFDCASEIYNVVDNGIACQLFILTLKEDASEWYYLLLPGTITSWNVLEKRFVEKYFSRKDPYFVFLKLIEIQMNEEEMVKDLSFIFMKVIHEIPQEMFPNDVIILSCYENSLSVNLRF
jgi:hypothetical protein